MATVVENIIKVVDESSQKLDRIERSAGRADKTIDGLTSKLKKLAPPLAAAFGLMASVRGARDYVKQIERIQVLTGMGASNITGMQHAMRSAGLQGSEMESVFANMAANQAEFTGGMRGAIEASKRLGVDLDKGPRQQLIEMARLVEQGKLGTAGVAEMTRASGPALANLMDMLRQGSTRLTATIEEGQKKNKHINDETLTTFKKFDAMMARVKSAWMRISTIVLSKLLPGITKGGLNFERIIDGWAEGAAKVGSVIASVGGFLAKHGTLLGVLVKSLLIMKAGKMIGGFFLNQANNVSAMFGAMTKKTDGVNKGFGKMIGKLGGVAQGLGIFYVALRGLANWVDEQQEKGIQAKVDVTTVRGLAPEAEAAAKKIAARGAVDLVGQKDIRNITRKQITAGVLTGMIGVRTTVDREGKKTQELFVKRAKVAERFLAAGEGGFRERSRKAMKESFLFIKNTELLLKIAKKDASILSNEAVKRLKLTKEIERRGLGPKAPGAITPGERPGKGDINMNFPNARFDIRQEFAEGFDPDRIAAVFANELSDVGERRLQSGLAPIFTVR
jgi:hypothetical protein